ncbi:CoA transferase [Moritella sp. 5]|uniref:CoA transferase n=1 Tax=Moritella sp. 5 TaxID=2746231 RepID=UPI001BA859F8|nr:CoA transferase [Moritella sp. 5]QUM81850.1 CoA transferase [Moritella sp. 5]
MTTQIQLPLKGISIIDFGQQIAGPGAAMILADLGATVIHIDPPTGPLWDHPANAILNRNKSCLRLDLKDPTQRKEALALIAKADVVLESFRPGVMKKLGIDFEILRQENPALVTLSIPGFASNDELRRGWKATEAIVSAASGAFSDMGYNRVLMGLNPSFSPLPLGSSYATVLAASAVILALYAREKSGRGDHIEVPIVAALMEGLSYNSYVVENLPNRYKTMRDHEIEYRQANNIEMDLSYEDLQEYLDPFYRTYLCADGRMFYCVCPSHRNHAKRALKALGIYEELISDGLPEVENLHLPTNEWDGETSIGVYPLPKKWADIISTKMKVAFLTKTSEEWGGIFGEGKIPGAPHRTTQEWVNSEHCEKSGLIVKVEDSQYGLMKQPGPIAWLEECATDMVTPTARMNVTVARALGLLSVNEAARNLPEASTIVSHKGWLDGIKILDLTNVIAGPHAAALLTRFGAEVTKIDTVSPMYDPLIGTFFTFLTNMGKKSALIDIMSNKGREVFNRLVQESDIVLINAPSRQMVHLGLDSESLLAINPKILFCRLDCLGGPLEGPKTNYIGYDDIIQANSGIMSRFGGIATPEEHAHLGTLDVNCGFAGGLAMATSLFHLQRTGEVSRARTSLSAVTNLAQLPFAFDYEGRAPFNEPSGRDALGNNALSHFYKTLDGWIFIDSNMQEQDKLATISGLEKLTDAQDKKVFLTSILVTKKSQTWIDALHQIDIAAVIPRNIEDLRKQYSREINGTAGIDRGSYAFSIYPNHPSGHKLTQVDHYAIRPVEAFIKSVTPTERFGHSTQEVLAGVGYDKAEIAAMIEEEIAGLGWGKEFLPSDGLTATEKVEISEALQPA